MKFVSWNVNGLRAVMKRNFIHLFNEFDADAVCLQEIKARPEDVELPFPGHHVLWNSALKRGYSGTMILSKRAPISVFTGIGIDDHDREGRVLVAEFDDFFLVNVYTPNAQRGLTRLDYRMEWEKVFLKFLKNLEKRKPVIVCGDLNVAHKEIDIARPKDNRRNPGFTDEERSCMDRLIEAGFVDTFRVFEPGGGRYTWWRQFGGAREMNIGWRIDYFLVSKALKPRLRRASILPHVMGSDHCPVTLEIE